MVAGTVVDRMLTTTQVAELLGVSGETVRQLCVSRHLPAIRTRGTKGHFRIRQSAVLAYMAGELTRENEIGHSAPASIRLPHPEEASDILEVIRRL